MTAQGSAQPPLPSRPALLLPQPSPAEHLLLRCLHQSFALPLSPLGTTMPDTSTDSCREAGLSFNDVMISQESPRLPFRHGGLRQRAGPSLLSAVGVLEARGSEPGGSPGRPLGRPQKPSPQAAPRHCLSAPKEAPAAPRPALPRARLCSRARAAPERLSTVSLQAHNTGRHCLPQVSSMLRVMCFLVCWDAGLTACQLTGFRSNNRLSLHH